ncbi:MAG TPA: bile acid:sodium symporter [Methylomirabilota bacterium]|nr:bile acid:sodium symporter [Methylomirabilota bacterium]
MESFPEYINILNYLFVAVYIFSVALETTHAEIVAEFRDKRRMGLTLLANFVIVPIVGLTLVRALELRPEIRIGIMMLACSPGGLFALQFARVSKGNRVFAVALLIVLTLLAVLITPLLLAWFFPERAAEGRVFGRLVLLLLLVIAVPYLMGRGMQRLIPEVAPKLGRFLGLLSIVIFIIAALASSKYKRPAIETLGVDGIVAIVVLTIVSWVVGWLLGGPEIRNRKVLAISTAMRNFGVCFPLAATYFPGTEVLAPILAFSGISIPMNMVFALVTGRLLRDKEKNAEPMAARS